LPGDKFRCAAKFERDAHSRGYRLVAGLDEAGRGCLFGPVYAAAVILSPDRSIRGLNDSKLLEPERRKELAVLIRERAVAWAVASADASEIDRINIYQASRLAMKRAVEQLPVRADFLLVDALEVDLPVPQQALIHGDARCRSIAAASILAKVDRDECMCSWDQVFPQYGFARHKGYGTPEHTKALDAYGPTSLHRFSFEPVRSRSGAFPRTVSHATNEQLPLWNDDLELCR
jgi:ribonuclease HII